MTPSERERRIDAARGLSRDELVEKLVDLQERASLGVSWLENAHERAQRAEAAATDFAKVLAVVAKDERGARLAARAILARHPSFSGEEGTEG